jgi:hypothetical protein
MEFWDGALDLEIEIWMGLGLGLLEGLERFMDGEWVDWRLEIGLVLVGRFRFISILKLKSFLVNDLTY